MLVFELVVNDGLADSLGDRVVIGVDHAGTIADAGRPVIVSPDDSVYLSGLRTIGRPGEYAWTRSDGNSASITLAQADTPAAAFSAPRTPGTYRFRLTVDDDTDTSDEIIVIVTRKVSNAEPDADAGDIATLASPGSFTLDGSGSADGDSDPLRHEWHQVGGTDALLTGTGATRDGTAQADDDILRFLRMVHDGWKYGPPDQATVMVGALPRPVADAGDDIEGEPGDTISFTNSGERLGPGRTVAVHEWVQLTGLDFYDVRAEDPGFNRNAPVPTIRIPNGSLASLTPDRSILFGMRLADDQGMIADLDLVTVKFTDLPANSAPEATARASASAVRPTTSVMLTGTAFDRDGDSITVRWEQTQGPATVTIRQANTLNASFTAPSTVGTYLFRFTVDDNTGEANAVATDTVTVTVNGAPTLSAVISPPYAPAGATVSLNGSATTDPDGDTLTFFWQEVAPPGPAFPITDPTAASTNFMVGPYVGTIAARTRTFQLTVTDAVGPTTTTVTFIPNSPPVPGGLATTATKIRYDGTATATLSSVGTVDPDGDPLTISWRIVSGPVNTTGGALTTAMGLTTGFTVAKPTSANPNTGGVWTIGGTVTDTLESAPELTIGILAFPSWSNDVWPILQNSCATSSCHNSGSNVLFMGSSASTAYSNMVNQSSSGSSNLRVAPNDHKKSYLWQQVNSGTMPKFGSKLSQENINIIRDWIEPEGLGTSGTLSTGAENN